MAGDYRSESRRAGGMVKRLLGFAVFHFGLGMSLVLFPVKVYAISPAETWVLLTLWVALVVIHFNLLVLRSRLDELLFHFEWVNRDRIAPREETIERSEP